MSLKIARKTKKAEFMQLTMEMNAAKERGDKEEAARIMEEVEKLRNGE